MKSPLKITFRDIDPSEAIERRIRREVDKLQRGFDRMTDCRVVIEAPHQRHAKGRIYRVTIEANVPGHEIVVSSDPLDHAHEAAYVAIRDAFRAARRQLEEHGRRGRGEVKVHAGPPHGRIVRLFPDNGFVETVDGQEVCFRCNAVVNDAFERIEVGAEVRLVVAPGEKGAQASTVTPIGKHHPL
ncbi:MAG: HPF/RaiA family ribosome-associated protein [Alphaproteobacteria bacterium]|nr:HPF/RaiA family ribosome-associated protein [Alphaproteobacteria bacterium]